MIERRNPFVRITLMWFVSHYSIVSLRTSLSCIIYCYSCAILGSSLFHNDVSSAFMRNPSVRITQDEFSGHLTDDYWIPKRLSRITISALCHPFEDSNHGNHPSIAKWNKVGLLYCRFYRQATYPGWPLPSRPLMVERFTQLQTLHIISFLHQR